MLILCSNSTVSLKSTRAKRTVGKLWISDRDTSNPDQAEWERKPIQALGETMAQDDPDPPNGPVLESANETEEIFEEHFAPSQAEEIIEQIEVIVIGEPFQGIQNDFLDTHCGSFDESTDENPLMYTSIFQTYQQLVENFLIAELRRKFPDFSLANFLPEIESFRESLTDEVLEIIETASDFLTFKRMILEHKSQIRAQAIEPLGSLLVINALR
eukprot:maker-scaffold176_size284796-snap-gene-1.22 protein:Tk06858 transcript:maker-scaffold176_size284796-snap-gene-1.22-mRNA-1 annotation:"adp-ribosylation factor-like protein 2-binding"